MSSNRTHQADRYCVECEKSFYRPSELRRHIKHTLTHNVNARQHRCYICNKAFTQKSNLPQHLKGVHKIRVVDEYPWGRKIKTPAKPKKGPRLARKNIRREASPFINYQWSPVVSALSSEGAPSVPAQSPSPTLVSTPQSTSAFAPVDTPYFGNLSFSYNGPMDTSPFLPKSSIPLSFDYGSPGSSFSSPMTSPSTSSFDDDARARESAELEPLVRSYFATFHPYEVPPFPNTAVVNYPNGNGGVLNSPTNSLVYNADGSRVPDRLEGYHGTETPSYVPFFNERLAGRLMEDVSRQKNHLQELYSHYEQPQYPQLQYPQQPGYQQDCSQQQQQIGDLCEKMKDILSPECMRACDYNSITWGTQGQVKGSSGLPGGMPQLGNGAPY